MESLWFWLLTLMLVGYVVFDGFDLGAGALHLLVARTKEERRLVLRSIGPVWDGNEVWLIAAGGTMVFAFPALYASSFSGFYLPLMIVLWLLILRGVAIEFRNHLSSPLWSSFFDVVFCGASALLALFLGAALGNVVRGVPLDAEGWFFLPLWTDLRVSGEPGIIDGYTLLVGVLAVAALCLHGALWIAVKCEGSLLARARAAVRIAWWFTVVTTVLVTVLSRVVRPLLFSNFVSFPPGAVFPVLAAASLLGIRFFQTRRAEVRAFLSSCVFLASMLLSVAFCLHPDVLPAIPGNPHSLTLTTAAASPRALGIALFWWIPGMLLVCGYFTYTYRSFAGKLESGESGH